MPKNIFNPTVRFLSSPKSLVVVSTWIPGQLPKTRKFYILDLVSVPMRSIEIGLQWRKVQGSSYHFLCWKKKLSHCANNKKIKANVFRWIQINWPLCRPDIDCLSYSLNFICIEWSIVFEKADQTILGGGFLNFIFS